MFKRLLGAISLLSFISLELVLVHIGDALSKFRDLETCFYKFNLVKFG
jgi:hypothetical protein